MKFYSEFAGAFSSMCNERTNSENVWEVGHDWRHMCAAVCVRAAAQAPHTVRETSVNPTLLRCLCLPYLLRLVMPMFSKSRIKDVMVTGPRFARILSLAGTNRSFLMFEPANISPFCTLSNKFTLRGAFELCTLCCTHVSTVHTHARIFVSASDLGRCRKKKGTPVRVWVFYVPLEPNYRRFVRFLEAD